MVVSEAEPNDSGEGERGTDLRGVEKVSQNHSEEEQEEKQSLVAGHMPGPSLNGLYALLSQGILTTTL